MSQRHAPVYTTLLIMCTMTVCVCVFLTVLALCLNFACECVSVNVILGPYLVLLCAFFLLNNRERRVTFPLKGCEGSLHSV